MCKMDKDKEINNQPKDINNLSPNVADPSLSSISVNVGNHHKVVHKKLFITAVIVLLILSLTAILSFVFIFKNDTKTDSSQTDTITADNLEIKDAQGLSSAKSILKTTVTSNEDLKNQLYAQKQQE
jgi:hypothetical protein